MSVMNPCADHGGRTFILFRLKRKAASDARCCAILGKPPKGTVGSFDELVSATQKACPGKAGKIELYYIGPKYLGSDPMGHLPDWMPPTISKSLMSSGEFRNEH